MTRSMLASAVGIALLFLAGCSAHETQTRGPVAWLAGEEPKDVLTSDSNQSSASRPDRPDGPKPELNASARQPSNIVPCHSDRHESCDR
jgi:hypothetical protein